MINKPIDSQSYQNPAGFFFPIKLWHGTTTLAVMFRAGILVAVDSRASMGKNIGSDKVKKIIEISSFFIGTMAGSAADCFFWEKNLSSLCHLYKLENNQYMSISGASKLLANMIYKYKDSGLSIGSIITGWDQNGPGIYFIDSQGSRFKVKIISVGSGSTYAYGILESKYEWNMSIEDACELTRRAVYQATTKDPFSGGSINLYLIRKKEWIYVSSDDVDFSIFDKYDRGIIL